MGKERDRLIQSLDKNGEHEKLSEEQIEIKYLQELESKGQLTPELAERLEFLKANSASN